MYYIISISITRTSSGYKRPFIFKTSFKSTEWNICLQRRTILMQSEIEQKLLFVCVNIALEGVLYIYLLLM